MRLLGHGKEGAKRFCAIMNLPKPPTKFKKYQEMLLDVSKELSDFHRMNAIDESQKVFNDGKPAMLIGFDGTWLKRGFNSHYCVVSASYPLSNKIIGTYPVIRYCSKCKGRGQLGECDCNFRGSSGAMEAFGAVKLIEELRDDNGAYCDR